MIHDNKVTKYTYWKLCWRASQDICTLLQVTLHIQHHQQIQIALECNQDKDPSQEHTQVVVFQTSPNQNKTFILEPNMPTQFNSSWKPAFEEKSN